MWKLFGRGSAPLAAAAALAVFGAVTMPASISRACDDDYRQPVGYAPYPAPGPTVVVVDPRDRDDRYYDHWRQERAARRYWYWRGREGHHRHERWD